MQLLYANNLPSPWYLHLALFYCHFVCSSVLCLRSMFFTDWLRCILIFVHFSEVEACGCPCGQNCVLFLREDLCKMEAVSQKFEQEYRILEEVQQQMQQNGGPSLQTKLLPCTGGDEYIPYCEISYEENVELTEELHDQSQDFDFMSSNGKESSKFDAPAGTLSTPASATSLGRNESSSSQNDVSFVFLDLKL